MKNTLTLCIAVLCCSIVSYAAQVGSYPEDKPLIDLAFPDDWDVKLKSGALYANPKDDASYFIAITPMEAVDPKAAIAEAKADTEELFKNVKYQKPQTSEGGGVEVLLINAKGEDEDGKANINLWIVGQKDVETLLLVKCVSSQAAFEKHGEAGLDIVRSITAHGKKPEAEEYHFPDKEHAIFSMDVPAGWKMESDEQGAHIVSTDKLFTLNVIVIDMEHIGEAAASITKTVSDKYDSAVWNEGGEPKVHVDEATGNTLISSEGVGEGGGIKHKLGVYQFAKKGSEKFFVLTAWSPLKAAEVNGDEVLKMLTSVKLK